MGVFTRLSNILSGKANKVLDGLENPIEQIDVAIRNRQTAVDNAKRESASFIGSINEKRREVNELKSTISQYEEGIKKALSNNDEEKATKFLVKKKDLDKKLESLNITIEKISTSANLVKENIKKLENEVEELKSKKSELAARYSTAEAQAKVNEILTNVNKDSNISIDEIERKIQEKENYANGLESFKEENPEDELKSYLNENLNSQDLKSELDKYR
ncbi:PspA/IM30 family protein [Clostridium senegalense]|uniref:PspA/IM30 family protein n=1 Tax=Clostridium senegalense TaxID=1465809 RepID=UPI000287EF75|nr:PspA/IM30 family protein [Clostridium senegalense]MBU5228311.1 PspA/IM30 family protein [Clostridium senegalense]